MPILAKTTITSADDYCEVADLAGQKVHYATIGNLNESHPIQQDRLSAVEIPGVRSDKFSALMDTTFEKMRTNVNATAEKQRKRRPSFSGASTGTIAMYDPASHQLCVGSKGDSPAFLVVQYGEGPQQRVGLIRVSSLMNMEEVRVQNRYIPMLHNLSSEIPQRFGQPPWNKIRGNRLINVDQAVKNFAQAEWNLSNIPVDKIKTSLIIGSDGVFDSNFGNALGTELFTRTLANHHGNVAEAAADYARTNKTTFYPEGSKDNLSAVVIEDLRKGKGDSVAVAVCDGFDDDGHVIAQVGIKTFEDVMRHHEQYLEAAPRGPMGAATRPPPRRDR